MLAVMNGQDAALARAAVSQASSNAFAALARRNAEVVAAMGMLGAVRSHWSATRRDNRSQLRASDAGGGISAVSIAALVSVAHSGRGRGAGDRGRPRLASSLLLPSSWDVRWPVDQAISQWRGFVASRQARDALPRSFRQFLLPRANALPPPQGHLEVRDIAASPPGSDQQTLSGIRFDLRPGDGLGIIGPSAAGKSTLARILVGLWIPSRGTVRLDGATLDQWARDELGRFIGYLPQDVELFDGTVKQNIARFSLSGADADVVAAAQSAGAHEMILRLPEGYETRIGEGGSALSAGQRQRLALARALYGNPVLIVLDEPNSNLDADGDTALNQAIKGIRKRGGTVVVITHRPSAIAAVDLLLMLKDGRQVAFGPKDKVLRQVTQVTQPTAEAI